MKRFIIATLIISFHLPALHGQWEMVGKVTTGSQFELTHTGRPILSNDSTKIFFVGGGFFATYDTYTNTLTDFTRDFDIGDPEGMIIDYSRNRIICFKNDVLKAHDFNTHAIITEKSIGVEGTMAGVMYIDKSRDELIIIHRGYESPGAVSILNLNDFSKKHEFITNGRIASAGYAILDEERSNLYLFYDTPDRYEVFSLTSLQIVFSATIQVDYGSPAPLIDYKNDRIILCDGFEKYLNTFISLEDYTMQYPDTRICGYQISVDTVSNRIWNGNMNSIDAYDLKSLMLLETIVAPESFVMHSPFSCPKFNYLFGPSGDYILIFDLTTHEYLGRTKVGSSPYRIAVDYLKNTFYTRESNAAFTMFNDFVTEGIPRIGNTFELYQPWNGVEGGVEIWPEINKIFFAGTSGLVSFDPQTGSTEYVPVEFSREVEVDTINKRIFTSQSKDGPEPGTPENHLFAFDQNLDTLWYIPVPGVNGDIEYDGTQYLYANCIETLYGPGINTIYKIDTWSKEITDSIKFAESIGEIELSKELNKLYAIGIQTDSFSGRLFVIDCNDLTLAETIDMPGAMLGYLAESLEIMFIVRHSESSTDFRKILAYDISNNTIISEQDLPGGMAPVAISLNHITNTLYIVDATIGGVYKYRNDAFPAPSPPGAPGSPKLTIGDNQIEVSWDLNNTAAAYNLYRKKGNEDWLCVTHRPIVGTFYKDLNLINNMEYSYSLSLLSENYIEGEKSAVVKGIPKDLPDFELNRVYSDNICSNDGKDALFTFGIKEEALFNDTIRFTFENLPAGVITSSLLKIYEEDALSLKLETNGSAIKGSYNVTLIAAGGGQTHTTEFVLQVVDDIDIALDYHPAELKTGDLITIEGSTYPLTNEPLTFKILASDKSIIAEEDLDSDGNGVFKTEYITLTADTFLITARMKYYSISSDTIPVYIRPGDVSITCVTDITAATDVNWSVQITGRVFPKPDGGTVRLQIISPEESPEFAENIPLNEFGYYGHSFSPDTDGVWKITAYYSGNENYSSASSYTNFVPIGIKPGYAIIFVGDLKNESMALDSTFRRLGKYAYDVLLKRHLMKEDIYLLFPEKNVDLDGNGEIDDVDEYSGTGSLKEAFNWAKTNINDSLDLTLYMVSKGDSASFLTSGSDYLRVDSIRKWIDEFKQTQPHSLVNIIIENSYGSKYVEKLAGMDRRIVTSTDDTLAYFFNYGDISFSGYFWNCISLGASIGEAFAVTKSVLNDLPDLFFGQECLIDANFNHVANEEDDYSIASDIYLGYGTRVDNLAPEIMGSTLDVGIKSTELKKARTQYTFDEVKGSELYLSVLINSPSKNLNTVYAILIRKGDESAFIEGSYDQLPDHKKYELHRYGSTDYFIAEIDEFDDLGNYTFIVYATDASGLKAIPGYCQVSIVEIKGQNSIEEEAVRLLESIDLYPNPFTSHLTIDYELFEKGRVIIKIYDTSGNLLDVVDQGIRQPDNYSLEYTPENLSPGLYLITFEVTDETLNFIKSRIARRVIYLE